MSATEDWQMEIEPYQYHQVHVPVQVPPSGEERLESIDPSSETTKGRKTKAPTLRDSDWEPHKHRIHDLHIVQDKPLKEVKQIMHEQFNFSAEIRQYRSRITKWKLDKNIKPTEMKCIVKKRLQRKLIEPNKPELLFRVRGNLVQPAKVQRWMDRHDVPSSTLYAPSPVDSTPSAISCYTMSAVASPAPSSSSSTSSHTDDHFTQKWIDDSTYSTVERVHPSYSQRDLLANVLVEASIIGNSQELSVFGTLSSANSFNPPMDFDALGAFRDFVSGPYKSEKHGFIYRKLEADRPTLFVTVSRINESNSLTFNVYGRGYSYPSTLIELVTRIFYPDIRGQRAQYGLVREVSPVVPLDMPLCFSRNYGAMLFRGRGTQTEEEPSIDLDPRLPTVHEGH